MRINLNPDSRIDEAVDWLQSQFGYETSAGPRTRLHDMMHILSNAVSGDIADEKRAAVSENIMLNGFTSFADIDDGLFIPHPWAAQFTVEAIGADVYAREGIETLTALEKRFHLDPVGNAATLSEISRRLSASELSASDAAHTANRLRSIDDYFKQRHHNRSLTEFRLCEIFTMTLGDFGLTPMIKFGRMNFEFAPQP